MNFHNVFLICLSFYQLTILSCLLFSVFFNPTSYCHAHNSLPLDPTVSLLNPSFNLPYMPQSQVHLHSGFPNNFLWIFHQQNLVKSTNFDTVHYTIFSLLLLLPNNNNRYLPYKFKHITFTYNITSWNKYFKNPVLRERAWQRLEWEKNMPITFHWFTIHW